MNMNNTSRSNACKSTLFLPLFFFSLCHSIIMFAQTPVVCYSFNGDFLDSSSSTNHGTAGGSAAISTAYEDAAAGSGALSLDGADSSYVDLNTPLTFSGSQPWTSMFWARRSQLGSTKAMVMGNPATRTDFIWLNDNFTGLRFRSTANATLDFSVTQDTEFHHYALIADGAGTLTLFLDGNFVQSRSGDTSFSLTSIGSAYNTTGYAFDGILDEVQIYTNALSSNQVCSIYGNSTPAPVLDYSFDNDTLDSSSSTNHGTAGGNATITTASGDVAAGSGALSLDGADSSCVELGTRITFSASQPWTSMFWARRSRLGSTASMVMGDPASSKDFIWLNDNFTGFRFRSSANATLDFSVTQDTEFHHYALIADGTGSLTLVLDGNAVQSLSGDTSFSLTTIGSAYNKTGYAFDGILDEVKLYTNALSYNRICSIYTNEYSTPVPSEPAAPVCRVRVFLQGGQSNADGRADPSGQPSYSDVDFYSDTETRAGVLSDLYAGASETSQFGPELGFGRRLTDLLSCASTTRVAVIKYANGGTNLENDWKAGGDATTAGDGPDYLDFQQAVSDGLAALAGQYTGAVINIEGMIWMQGESDANNSYTNDYFSNLTNFVADVRSTFGTNLPFVIGRLSDAQTSISAPALAAIQAAQSAVAAADHRAGLVNTDAMAIKGDNLHFDVDGQLDLGKAFAYETAYLLWVESQLTPEEIDAGQGEPDADPDRDGIVNSDEFVAGTEILSTDSQFCVRMEASGDNTFDLTHVSHPGRLYQIESCTNLTDAAWTSLSTYTNAASGTLTYTVTNTPKERFYRIRAQLP
jgi:hypothetical protein